MIAVVIADQSRAQIFTTASLGEPLENVESLVNTSAHLQQRDLVTDGSGRAMNRAAGIHQSEDAGPSIRETARHRFAHDIAASIARQAEAPDCVGIVLVADPRLLSEIKEECKPPARSKLAGELPKNLMHAEMTELRDRLANLRRELRG